MRIVGGRFRGRSLAGPSGQAIRPTSDRLRESLFNVLAHAYGDPVEGARVIDLFAGTGALGLGGTTRLFRRDATKLGAMPPQDAFTLAFLDPPYGRDLAPRALGSLAEGGWLAPGALVLVEEAADVELSAPTGYDLLERRAYGDTAVSFMRKL